MLCCRLNFRPSSLLFESSVHSVASAEVPLFRNALRLSFEIFYCESSYVCLSKFSECMNHLQLLLRKEESLICAMDNTYHLKLKIDNRE